MSLGTEKCWKCGAESMRTFMGRDLGSVLCDFFERLTSLEAKSDSPKKPGLASDWSQFDQITEARTTIFRLSSQNESLNATISRLRKQIESLNEAESLREAEFRFRGHVFYGTKAGINDLDAFFQSLKMIVVGVEKKP